jgi:hypothetical protein
MRALSLAYCVCAGALLAHRFAHAEDLTGLSDPSNPASPASPVTPTPPEAPSAAVIPPTAVAPLTDDRIIISGDAMRLSGNHGGGGGLIDWLHNFSPDEILGVGGEHDFIYNSHWTFGSVFGSLSDAAGDVRWNTYGEVHRGAGDVGTKPFDYAVEAIGGGVTLHNSFSIQFESRQFDIDPTHGNLPKVTVSYLLAKQWLATVAYAHSYGGNLDTELTYLKLDHSGPIVSWLIGGAAGHAAPAVVNIITGQTGTPPQLREAFAGLSKAYTRVEWALLGDYLDLSGSKRVTVTLSCTIHARSGAPK